MKFLGENLGHMKTHGGLSVGVLFSQMTAGFCLVGYQGAGGKAASCVSLSHFFLWTEKKPHKTPNRIGGLNLTCLLKLPIENVPTLVYFLFINILTFIDQLSYLQMYY